MGCGSNTLDNLAAHSPHPRSALAGVASQLDALGFPWQFGSDMLHRHYPDEVGRCLPFLGKTRAAQEIKLVVAFADVLDSLARALPRWLAPLRRALAGRASRHRADARRRMVEIALPFLSDVEK